VAHERDLEPGWLTQIYKGIEKENIEKNEIKTLETGLILEMRRGVAAYVRPRSGLSSKGIIIPNSPGTINSDYRGERKILLMNLTNNAYTVRYGDRIAQLVFERKTPVEITFNGSDPAPPRPDQIQNTRGSRGFGSSGR